MKSGCEDVRTPPCLAGGAAWHCTAGLPWDLAAAGADAGERKGREGSSGEHQSGGEEKTSQSDEEVLPSAGRTPPAAPPGHATNTFPLPGKCLGAQLPGESPGCLARPQDQAAGAGMGNGSPEGHRTHAMRQPPTAPYMMEAPLAGDVFPALPCISSPVHLIRAWQTRPTSSS